MPTVMHKDFKLAGFIPGIISVEENEHNGAIRISLILWRLRPSKINHGLQVLYVRTCFPLCPQQRKHYIDDGLILKNQRFT